MKLFTLAIVVACFVASFGEKARFDNYRVYSVEVENVQQLKVLREFDSGLDGITFLIAPTGIHQTAEMVVPPHKFADMSELFEAYEMKNQIKIDNLQK